MATKYKPFGVDLDPKGELNETILPDGDVSGEIRGEKVNYDYVIDELEERANRVQSGKKPDQLKFFSGVGDNRINQSHQAGCACLVCRIN